MLQEPSGREREGCTQVQPAGAPSKSDQRNNKIQKEYRKNKGLFRMMGASVHSSCRAHPHPPLLQPATLATLARSHPLCHIGPPPPPPGSSTCSQHSVGARCRRGRPEAALPAAAHHRASRASLGVAGGHGAAFERLQALLEALRPLPTPAALDAAQRRPALDPREQHLLGLPEELPLLQEEGREVLSRAPSAAT